MITFSNITRHDNLPFEDYLKLPGFSHSFLKNYYNGVQKFFNRTDKVVIGKVVDLILSGGVPDIKDPLYPIGKRIAYHIHKEYGDVIELMEKQAAYTAELQYLKFLMTGKFLPDFTLKNTMVVDLKVTHEKITSKKKLQDLILYMGYHNQLWGYSGVAEVPDAYIMAHSVPLKETIIEDMRNIIPNWWNASNTFWEDKIVQFGTYQPDEDEEMEDEE